MQRIRMWRHSVLFQSSRYSYPTSCQWSSFWKGLCLKCWSGNTFASKTKRGERLSFKRTSSSFDGSDVTVQRTIIEWLSPECCEWSCSCCEWSTPLLSFMSCCMWWWWSCDVMSPADVTASLCIMWWEWLCIEWSIESIWKNLKRNKMKSKGISQDIDFKWIYFKSNPSKD